MLIDGSWVRDSKRGLEFPSNWGPCSIIDYYVCEAKVNDSLTVEGNIMCEIIAEPETRLKWTPCVRHSFIHLLVH